MERKPRLEDVERVWILHILEKHEWNRTHAIQELGISLRCIRNRISAWRSQGHVIPDFDQAAHAHACARWRRDQEA